MPLGDRFLKKVTGKSSAGNDQRTADDQRTTTPQPLRSQHSNHSVLSSASTSSGSDAQYTIDSHQNHHQHHHHHHHQHADHQQQAPHRQQLHRPASSKSMKAANTMNPVPGSSISGSSSSGSGATKSASPVILHKGYMLVKKGILKGYEKRFFFLTPHSPELFSFRDEIQFDEWLSSGLPLRKNHHEKSKDHGQVPILVCTVLRADRAGDSGASDRAIAVISGDESKCTSTKYLAPTPDDCEVWIEAFHAIQSARRAGFVGNSGLFASGASGMTVPGTSSGPSSRMDAGTPMHGRSNSVADSYEARHHYQQQQYGRGGAAAKASTSVSSRSSRHSDASDSPSHLSAHHARQQHSSAVASSISYSAAAPPASASMGNVLLFVPASGSAISISDTKLQQAKQEMDELVARGAKRLMRGGMENAKSTTWRYGPPEYVLSDLEYIKGKTRDDDSTPLESYAEMCCQTFLLEATHKAHYSEWTSVRQDYFFIQVNDGDKIPGHQIQENDLFGLLYLNDYEVDMELRDGEERKDPRAILSEAFTQGFPMEVLDVFTQPPQCHFSWRHWGRFKGRYRGVRGNGELIEIRGFGQMHIDAGRMLSLRLFFKQRDLFDQLNKATAAALPATTRTVRQNTVCSAKDAGVSVASSAASTASAVPAPTQQQPQQPQAKPSPSPQVKPVRADKLISASSSSSNGLIGDFTQCHIATPELQGEQPPQARSTSVSRPHSQSTDASGPHPHVNRTNIYQKFMPQATGA